MAPPSTISVTPSSSDFLLDFMSYVLSSRPSRRGVCSWFTVRAGATPTRTVNQVRKRYRKQQSLFLVRSDHHVVEECRRAGLLVQHVGDVGVQRRRPFAVGAGVLEFNRPLLRLALAALP